MINFTGTYTDQYQLTMAQVYFLTGQKDRGAIFDYFFRQLPFGGGYAVFAGLEDLVDALEDLHFDSSDIAFLKEQGLDPSFIHYLKTFRFKGKMYASYEGDVVFPMRPILSIEANIIEAQIIETMLLNILNFQTLIATKASRMRWASGDRKLLDFGLRRAQGVGGYYASRAAMIGGFDATSNVRAARDYGLPLSGTMAHSFVQSYEDELTAFREFAKVWPDNCVLLVDTYDTLRSGLPNAIKIGQEMRAQGKNLQGIRLDSGDLADLAKKARLMLNAAGLHDVKIIVSNQLDEMIITRLLEQGAPIDGFGVGTSLATGRPDAFLDGVYKLAEFNQNPCIKLSENKNKISLPYKKQVYRILEEEQPFFCADLIALAEEKELGVLLDPFKPSPPFVLKNHKIEPLLHPVMMNGKRLFAPKTSREISSYSQTRLNQLPEGYKRLIHPQSYRVGMSEGLKSKRDTLIEAHLK